MVPSITPLCSEVIISARPIGTAVAPNARLRGDVDAHDALGLDHAEDEGPELRIAQRAVGVVAILEQVRNAERAEPRVDAGEEVRRVRISLDGPELQSLDMRGRSPELPAGENLDLDP